MNKPAAELLSDPRAMTAWIPTESEGQLTDTPEVSEPDTPDGDWDAAADGASFPEYPANPHNHRYTISIDSRGPMLVFRANTCEEIKEACEELEDAATGAALGRAWAAMKAGAALGSGLQATPAPAAPQMPPQGMPQVPAGPPVGYVPPPPPPAPAAPQGGGRAEPKPRPPWPQVYKISIARGDQSFKQYREANQQYFKGKVQWAGGGEYWIHGDVVQAVAQWNPVPA